MNLTQAGLSSSFALDMVNRQLSNGATSGVSYDPLSKTRVSAHETDKQAEDNATWYFEYRALLNSKLTTLITSLTSAYTTDMDAAMGATNPAWATGVTIKGAMQGLTGKKNTAGSVSDPPIVDPGAARTTYAYLNGFALSTDVVMGSTPATGWRGDSDVTPSDPSASVTATFNSTVLPAAVLNPRGVITGTTTFMNGGNSNFVLDELKVNMDPYIRPPASLTAAIARDDSTFANAEAQFATYNINRYTNNKTLTLNNFDRSTTSTSDFAKAYRAIGNNFEYTLYKFFERPENLDLIRFGLFKDVYVVGTSSLPTGSQTQGSLSLDWDANTQKIRIKQERYACFFHS